MNNLNDCKAFELQPFLIQMVVPNKRNKQTNQLPIIKRKTKGKV